MADKDIVRDAIDEAFRAKVADLFKMVLLDAKPPIPDKVTHAFHEGFLVALELRDAALKAFCT